MTGISWLYSLVFFSNLTGLIVLLTCVFTECTVVVFVLLLLFVLVIGKCCCCCCCEVALTTSILCWFIYHQLTPNAPITTKVVCFYRLLKCLRSLYGKQCGPRSNCSIGAVCSGSILFASILNSSVMLGNYLHQTTTADDIFRCIFWHFKG